MEGDVFELLEPLEIAVFGPNALVRFPEEFRIREARADHPLIAADDDRAAILRLDIRGEEEAIGQAIFLPPLPVLRAPLSPQGRGRFSQNKAFLVRADGRADHLARHIEEGFLERTHQHHGPFDKARDLFEQALVFHQLQPLREGEVLRIGPDDLLAAIGIENHLRGFELRDVIIEAAHADFARRHEAVAIGDIARLQAIHLEGHDLGIFGLGAEGREDGTQGAHPA